MDKQQKGYKRINFFKGFLTTEDDWNAAESYHIEKRQLHNRIMHSPGIVLGQGGDLRVMARSRGDMAVEVQPGFAVDGKGRDLILWDAVIKNINPDEYRLPQTVYLVLRFREELTDYIAYKENLDYKGHRRVQESAVVEISQTEPNIANEVELARIYLEKGETRIRDARNADDPRSNEIDTRFRPRAGVVGSFLAPALRLRAENVLWHLHKTFLEYARGGVFPAHSVLHATSSALMLSSTNLVDMRNIFDVFYFIVEAQGEVCLDIDVNHPSIAKKEEYTDYKRHVEILRGLLGEQKNNLEALTNLLAYQTKATDVAKLAVTGKQAKVVAPKKEEKKAIDLSQWDVMKTVAEPKQEIEIEGTTWVLIDEININDKQSEEKHQFKIDEAKDSYRSRQKLKYPDGTVVSDVGRAHVGGYAKYTVSGVKAGRPLVILRRMDYIYGDYELEYFVNDTSAGFITCTGTDRIHRWRNWPMLIESEHVTATKLNIRQAAVTAGRDVNMFQIWLYQPK